MAMMFRELVLDIVSTVSKGISKPMFVKIRLLDTLDDTIELCRQLADAGAALIAIHGRYRVNLVGRTGPGARDGPAHLDQIAAVKAHFASAGEPYNRIPIISNGNVITWDDVQNNFAVTGADGIMSAEGILDNPALFYNAMTVDKTKSKTSDHHHHDDGGGGGGGSRPPSSIVLALEYLDLVDIYPTKLKSVVFHVRRMLKKELTDYQLMEECVTAADVRRVREVVLMVKSYADNGNFTFDGDKAKRMKELAARKAFEEGKRKAYEERMRRKAKREGKVPTHYLLIGADVPTVEEIQELKTMTKEAAFKKWGERHSQHCFAFHLDPNGCARDRTCAFLHSDPNIAEPLAFG